MTVDAAYAVEQYCLSVNPSSSSGPPRSAEERAADLIAAAPLPERTSDPALQPSGPNRSVLSSES
jgi:hypothetical protein